MKHMMYTTTYDWVPTQRQMQQLENFSSIWSDEDWKRWTDWNKSGTGSLHEHERCNAIQMLVRANLWHEQNIYFICDIDDGAVRPCGLVNDPIVARARKQPKPNADADIVKLLEDAQARFVKERADKNARIGAEYARRLDQYRLDCEALLHKELKACQAAAAPLTMAEKLRGVVKPPAIPWEQWQMRIVYPPKPTWESVVADMELAPFVENVRKVFAAAAPWSHEKAVYSSEEMIQLYAKRDMEASKAPPAGPVRPGVWQRWEVEFVEEYTQYRASMTPY